MSTCNKIRAVKIQDFIILELDLNVMVEFPHKYNVNYS